MIVKGGFIKKLLTKDQIKMVEKKAIEKGISEDQLMKNAGAAAEKFIDEKIHFNNKKCVVLCGRGNNGGDGYALARNLYNKYVDVDVISVGGEIKSQNVIDMKTSAEKLGVKVYKTDDINAVSELIEKADILVDAVCGSGFSGEMSDELQALNIIWNKSKAVKLALDIPTGIVADTGEVSKFCFVSDYTISFIALKPAHILASARECCGKVFVTDIGVKSDIIEQIESRYFLIDDEMVWNNIKIRNADTHKGDYGRLFNLSGSQNMRGAAALSTLGALRVGAGIVTLGTIDKVINSLASVILEAKFLKLSENLEGTIAVNSVNEIIEEISQSDGCLMGCGLGLNSDIIRLVYHIIRKATCPLIIDADAINAVANDIKILKEKQTKIILTPHIGEMSKLMNLPVSEIINNKYKVISEFSKEYNVTVVLKDYNTVIVDEEGKIYVDFYGGNPGLARGGSGDVLAGIIAGLVVQGVKNAPACGVYLHSRAAKECAKRKSKYGMLPSDIFEDLSEVFLKAGR